MRLCSLAHFAFGRLQIRFVTFQIVLAFFSHFKQIEAKKNATLTSDSMKMFFNSYDQLRGSNDAMSYYIKKRQS